MAVAPASCSRGRQFGDGEEPDRHVQRADSCRHNPRRHRRPPIGGPDQAENPKSVQTAGEQHAYREAAGRQHPRQHATEVRAGHAQCGGLGQGIKGKSEQHSNGGDNDWVVTRPPGQQASPQTDRRDNLVFRRHPRRPKIEGCKPQQEDDRNKSSGDLQPRRNAEVRRQGRRGERRRKHHGTVTAREEKARTLSDPRSGLDVSARNAVDDGEVIRVKGMTNAEPERQTVER